MTTAIWVLAFAILFHAGTLFFTMTKASEAAAAENAALDRLSASTDALTNAVAALTTQANETAAALRSIATDTGDNDQTIRINALADKLDSDVATITAALTPAAPEAPADGAPVDPNAPPA